VLLPDDGTTFAVGPSLSLTSGTWFLSGTITISGTDGVTVAAELLDKFANLSVTVASTFDEGEHLTLSLSGIVTVTNSATVEIVATSDTAATYMMFETPQQGTKITWVNASNLNALQIQ
jgi:hypothetical protein